MKFLWPVALATGPTLPAPWWIAVGYAQQYKLGVHTGLDFNLHGFADSGAPVNAIAPGEVVFAGDGAAINWPNARGVVCVKHEQGIWTRYAHIATTLKRGDTVREGQRIGTIADYGAPGKPDDHLHFDMSTLDLGIYPGDWPGHSGGAMNRVRTHYLDPILIYRLCNS